MLTLLSSDAFMKKECGKSPEIGRNQTEAVRSSWLFTYGTFLASWVQLDFHQVLYHPSVQSPTPPSWSCRCMKRQEAQWWGWGIYSRDKVAGPSGMRMAGARVVFTKSPCWGGVVSVGSGVGKRRTRP